MAIEQGDAIDGADLVEHHLLALRGEAAIWGTVFQVVGLVTRSEIKGGYRDNGGPPLTLSWCILAPRASKKLGSVSSQVMTFSIPGRLVARSNSMIFFLSLFILNPFSYRFDCRSAKICIIF